MIQSILKHVPAEIKAGETGTTLFMKAHCTLCRSVDYGPLEKLLQ